MKTALTTILWVCMIHQLSAQHKDTTILKSQIKKVTVFFDGAQITHEAQMRAKAGKHYFLIDKLPAELNPKSIQINTRQQGNILFVKHDLSHPSENHKLKLDYEEKIKLERMTYKDIANQISVFTIEEKILLDNSILNRKEAGTSISEIKEAAAFYREKLNEIKREKLKLIREQENINERIQKYYQELNEKLSKVNKPYSQVSFVLETDTYVESTIEISYFVLSAGWSPTYDFRVRSIEDPLRMVYNANIYQSTGEDWQNVSLRLSTNTPSVSHIKPELYTWHVDRRNTYAVDNAFEGQAALQGKVLDKKTSEPIPFANIVVMKDGKTIAGTTSDFDGHYTIKPIKPGFYNVQVSFVGYDKLDVQNVSLMKDKITFQDFEMFASSLMLEEVKVVEYSASPFDKDASTVRGSSTTVGAVDILSVRNADAVASSVGGVYGLDGSSEHQFIGGYQPSSQMTSLEYKIDIPYSIPSDGKDYLVKIQEIESPVNYVFYAIPKLDPDVYLIAEIKDWNRLNLLSGNSSVYYQGTFTGQSAIDAASLSDTLQLSLSRDKNIVVERTSLKEKNEKQWLGKNIKETIHWNITVKNNKELAVRIVVEDQFPISELKSIEIEKLEYSGGKVNNKTGKVVWEFVLQAGEKKELLLQYAVKYPSYMNLNVE